MRMPYLNSVYRTEEFQEVFGGYNHTENCSELEFYDMENMSSDLFPALAPRNSRSALILPGSPVRAILAKDKFCYVAGNRFYIDNEVVPNFEISDEGPIRLTSMGANVIILPQKLYVNTIDPKDHGPIEKIVKVEPIFVITNRAGTFYYDASNTYPWTEEDGEKAGFYFSEINVEGTEEAITVLNVKTKDGWIQEDACFGISNLFNVNFPDYYGKADFSVFAEGTPVELSIEEDPDNILGVGGNKIIEKISRDMIGEVIIFKGFLPEGWKERLADNKSVILKQKIPNMDFVIESGNRLWGCRYGENNDGDFVNEIYASALGDFSVWYDFTGEASDSYFASVGSDGPFTGAVTYKDSPYFFKENCFHRVYGTIPENYQIITYENDGLQNGSSQSFAIVENTLFYKGVDSFFAFDGTVPQSISAPLGREKYYDAVGGVCDQKYYVSCRTEEDKYLLLVYDAAKNLWHKEDDLKILDCTTKGNTLYCLTDENVQVISRSLGAADKDLSWFAKTGIIGKTTPDKKSIQKLKIRAEVERSSMVQVLIEYDSSGVFENLFLMEGRVMQSYSIPIKIHRCDHFRIMFKGRGPAKIYSLSKVTMRRNDKG